MKITLTDGSVIEKQFTPANCTGYRATFIEIDADDIRKMRNLAHRNPTQFQLLMNQLEARFPDRRPLPEPHRWL